MPRRAVTSRQLAQHTTLQASSVVVGVILGGLLTMLIKQGLKQAGKPHLAEDFG